jgi:glutathione reductase (NADPH)
MSENFDLFVIGGGSGGTRCARIAAGHGARVGIAEERFWGGTCVNVGCVPKKLMVMAAEYGAACAASHAFGWDTQRGAHDWGTLIANKNDEILRLNGIYRRLLEGCGAELFEARARLLDAHTLDVGGRKITAEHIVIATGGRPLRPSFPGQEHCIVSDDAFFLPQRPRRVTILGGGYIAVEFAGIFAGLGSEVRLVMRQDFPLRGFDEDLRMALLEALQEQGIAVHTGTTIASVDGHGETRQVRLIDGSEHSADLVFAAIGRVPLTEGLGLEAAGVLTDGFGAVCVDAESRTNVESIFAIGDATNRMNLTPVAIAEGHSLADALFGPSRRYWALDQVATAVFSSPPIATVGMTELQAAARGPADIFLTRFTPMRYTLGGPGRPVRRSMMKLVVDQQSQVVVGAHMIGDDAPEIMQGLSVAINCGATKADFDRTVGIHPSSAEEFVTLRTRTRVAEGPSQPEQDAQQIGAEEMGAAEMGLGG